VRIQTEPERDRIIRIRDEYQRGWAGDGDGPQYEDAMWLCDLALDRRAPAAPHPLLAMERVPPDPGSRAGLVERLRELLSDPMSGEWMAPNIIALLADCLAALEER